MKIADKTPTTPESGDKTNKMKDKLSDQVRNHQEYWTRSAQKLAPGQGQPPTTSTQELSINQTIELSVFKHENKTA